MTAHRQRKKRRACPSHGWQAVHEKRRAADGRYLCACGQPLLTELEYAELSMQRSAARLGRGRP